MMLQLPHTLFCIRIDDAGVLIGPGADLLSELYPIRYYGYKLRIGLIPWGWAVENQVRIVRLLPGRSTFGLLP